MSSRQETIYTKLPVKFKDSHPEHHPAVMSLHFTTRGHPNIIQRVPIESRTTSGRHHDYDGKLQKV